MNNTKVASEFYTIADEIYDLVYEEKNFLLMRALSPSARAFMKMNRRARIVEKLARIENERFFDRMYMQSGVGELESALEFMAHYGEKYGKVIDLAENILLTIVSLSRSKSWEDILLALTYFAKLTVKGPLLTASVKILVTQVKHILKPSMPVMQDGALDYAIDLLGKMRNGIFKWEEVADSDIGKCTKNLAALLTNHSILCMLGIREDKKTLEMLHTSQGWKIKCDFVYAIFDFTTLTLHRGLLFLKTGEWSILVHGRASYTEWYEKCEELKRHSAALSNLEPHGTNYHQFVSDLEDVIEQGKVIVKMVKKYEERFVRGLYNDMLLIKSRHITMKAAQQERKAPFSLLVFGDSSIGKSSFQKILFYHYGKVTGLPIGDEYRYVRSPVDPFWSGFNSYKWFIQLDDIGFMLPNGQMDPTLSELIMIKNNVPAVPNQAALEDKGKTPIRCELLVASSNVKHLNAAAYFSCPLAVQRRLPWVITLRPKKEYEDANRVGMLDPAKLPELDDEYANFWHIKVERVIPAGKVSDKSMATHEVLAEYDDIYDFLDWYREIFTQYNLLQDKATNADKIMQEVKLCKTCYRPERKCECLKIQTRPQLPNGRKWGDTWAEQWVENDNFHGTDIYYLVDDKYMCKHITHRNGESNMVISPASFTYRPEPEKDLDVQLADVMEEVLMNSMVVQKKANRFTKFVVRMGFKLYRWSPLTRKFVAFLADCRPIRKIGAWCIVNSDMAMSDKMKFLGDLISREFVSNRWMQVITGLSAVGAAWVLFRAAKGTFRTFVGTTGSTTEAKEQGGTMSVPDSYFKTDERENVWKRNDYETTSFDYDPMSCNYAELPHDVLIKKLQKNCARIVTRANGIMIPGNAFCVGGHLWVTNNHVMAKGDEISVELLIDPLVKGTNANIKFVVKEHDLLRLPDDDLVFFEVFACDTRYDLTKLIAKSTFKSIGRGALLSYDDCIKFCPKEVKAMRVQPNYNSKMEKYFDYWQGSIPEDTVNGDCGSVMVMTSPMVVIVGLHQLGGVHKLTHAVPLTQDHITRARERFVRPMIQANPPKINYENTHKQIGELHHKSCVRWLKQGSLKVYGSYVGWRPKPRSRVSHTLLGEEIAQRRGWTIDFGAPDMRDWRCWHIALKDIVEQENKFDHTLLRLCRKSFSNEILARLTPDDLSKVRILSDYAAINGIPGVRFIDKMNFNTSTGEPYNHSKKYHLLPDPRDGSPEGRKFDEIMTKEIERIEKLWRAGVRSSCIFSAQQKDDAMPFAKLDAGKIRIFMAMCAAAAVPMRKYTLTMTKVLQENKEVFEAAPGLVCQSTEWEKLREYLIKFGEERMGAGDYKFFDKRMASVVILEAFELFVDIARAAGWPEEDIIVLYAMAEDIAYPYVNFNGDLIQLFGSNPSGHPWTVIINCIANALYFRYAFMLIVQDVEMLKEFKKYVKLITYGDDNAYNSAIDAFNHTSISKALSTIGVIYTMADKEADSVPFIHFDDVSFLKRTWRYDPDIGAHVCPLEEASIKKMLCIGVKGKTLSPEMRQAAVMNSALNEWFWYGKQRFEEERKFMYDLAVEKGISEELKLVGWPTWDELYDRFWKNTKQNKENGAGLSPSVKDSN